MTRRLYFWLFFGLMGNCILPSYSAYAQSPLSLSEAVRKCLANNFDIQIAQKEKEIAKLNNSLGAAGALPSINFNLYQSNTLDKVSNPILFPQGRYSDLGIIPSLDVEWLLFNGMKVQLTRQRQKTIEQLSEGNAQVTVENALQNIIAEYYRGVVEKELLDLQHNLFQFTEERYIAELRKQRGARGSVSLDRLLYENAYLEDSIHLVEQRGMYEKKMMDIGKAIGEKGEKAYYPIDKLNYEEQNYQFEFLRQRMFSNNDIIKNQKLQQQIFANQTKINRASQYPILVANAGAYTALDGIRYKDQERQLGKHSNLYLTFSFSMPIFNGGNLKRQVSIANLQERMAELQLKSLEQNMTNMLQSLVAQYYRQLKGLDISDRLVKNMQQTMQIADQQYRTNAISFIEFRQLQESYVEAIRNRLENVYMLKMTELYINRMTGNLNKYRNNGGN